MTPIRQYRGRVSAGIEGQRPELQFVRRADSPEGRKAERKGATGTTTLVPVLFPGHTASTDAVDTASLCVDAA
jgi:hypothetical protein